MTIQLAVAWFSFAFALLMIFSSIPMWSAAAQAYGRFPFGEAKLMLYYRFISTGSYMLYLPSLAIILMVTTNLFGLSSIPWIGVLGVILFQLYIILYQMCPPTVVFLTTSLPQSAALRYRIGRVINPYRVIVLLDPSCESASNAFYQNSLEWDNLRTKMPWEPVVHTLIAKAPRIIIDTRVSSPAVVYESKEVCADPRLVTKTFFIVDQNGAAPSLESAGISPAAPGCNIVREEDLVRTLRDSGLTRVASPDDHPWMKAMMNDKR